MQSQQTQLVSMQSVLACTGQSIDQHKLANYYHAILSIILAQFSHKGFENGMAGTVRLAQASPYIRVRSLPHCMLCLHSALCLDVTASWHVEHISVAYLNLHCNVFDGSQCCMQWQTCSLFPKWLLVHAMSWAYSQTDIGFALQHELIYRAKDNIYTWPCQASLVS